ncbi:MAG TPA: O-methyltransferase [Terracidiphilus sp.]|nr:O-methyltransferase [Terracidiphilus sp.]
MNKSSKTLWAAVDEYFQRHLVPADKYLDAAVKANRKAGLPAIDVSPLQGQHLNLLVRMTQPKRVLEIGTLGGYSTICMARALPVGGRIVTLEFSPRHAEVARKNLKNAGVLDRVDVRVGRAIDSLAFLEREGAEPFDFIFIDADKESNSEYVKWALRLSHVGTTIVVDNVVRDGKVIDGKSKDLDIIGTRRMTELIALEPRLSATVIQNVGAKGYDGFLLAVVMS